MEHDQPSGHWTNEKHSHYLDEMESSFVRTMLESGRSTRLDRYIPDSSDSTRDTPSRARNNKHPSSSSSSSSSGKGKKDARDDNNRWRRRPFTTTDDNSVLDQVVPQMSYKGDKGGKD